MEQAKDSKNNENYNSYVDNNQSNISGQNKIRFMLPTPKKPITSWHKSKMLAWEFFGTAIFAYGICASSGPIFISSALFAGILITAPFSGGHLNPAVSFGFFIKGQIGPFDFLFRAIGQVFGALFGAFMSFVVLNKVNGPVMEGINYHWQKDGETTVSHYLFDQWSVANASMGEFLGTFFLVFVILLMTDNRTTLIDDYEKKKKTVLTVFIIVLCFHIARAFTPRTGGSINPGIGFSLTLWHAIYVGDFEQMKPVWIYIIAPFLGSLLASVHYKFIHLPLVCDKDLISDDLKQKYKEIRAEYQSKQKQQDNNDIELNNMEMKTPLKDNQY